MNERLRKAFDGITPLSCDRELYEGTLGKAEAMRKNNESKKRKVNKPFVAVCAAATALAVGTVSVGAYYDWDFGKVLSLWLGNKDMLHRVISDVSVTDVKSSFDNLDINVGGGLTDGNISIIFLDITRTDGGIFDMSEYQVKFRDGSVYAEKPIPPKALFNELICSGESELTSENTSNNPAVNAKQCFIEDDNPVDNKLTMAVVWTESENSASREIQISLTDLKLAKLTVDREYSKNSEEKYIVGADEVYERFNGSYSAAVNMEALSTDVKSAEVSESATLNFYNHAKTAEDLMHYDIVFTLDSVTVSPMTVSFKAHSEIPEELRYMTLYKSIGYVTLKDGSTVNVGGSYEKPAFYSETGNVSISTVLDVEKVEYSDVNAPKYDRWDIDCSFMLEEAVELSDVVSVTIGGATVNLS